jgi:hypothetical protein
MKAKKIITTITGSRYHYMGYEIHPSGLIEIWLAGWQFTSFYWNGREVMVDDHQKKTWHFAEGESLEQITKTCRELAQLGFFNGKMKGTHPEEILTWWQRLFKKIWK